jgi:hypothetical protein
MPYTLKVGAPTFSPPAGTYSAAQSVTVSTTSAGAALRYTLDGSTPTESSPIVPAGGVVVGQSAILSVTGFKAGWTASDTTIGSYLLNVGTAATPTFSPPGGSYPGPQTVKVTSSTPGAMIRFTLDGSDPGPFSPLVTGLVRVDATATLKARAYKTDHLPSGLASAAYTISTSDVAPAVFAPPGGSYTTRRTVTLTSTTPGATIHYTTDGTEPDPSSLSVASGGSVLVDRAMRLTARAYASGYPATPAPSPIRHADYRITGALGAGYDSALALKTDGTLVAWGTNTLGAVGNGTTSAVDSPIPVPGMSDVVALSAGSYTAVAPSGVSFAVKADGSLYGFGVNAVGQLGIGNTTSPQTSPVQVKDPSGTGYLTSIVAVSAGPSHTLALTSTGEVYGWGLNNVAQTGAGNTASPKTLPVLVPGLSNVVAVAAGRMHSLALKADGTVVAWGQNASGMLGVGTTSSPILTPTPVAGLTNVVAIAAADDWSFALRAEDSVNLSLWSWGYGTYSNGKMFDGASVLRIVPGRVGDGLAVSASATATLVYRRESTGRGMIWGAGIHAASTLDPGAPQVTTVPVHVAEGEFVGFSAGISILAAIKPDLTLLAWGASARDGSGFSLGPPGAFTEDPDADGLTTVREWDLGTDPYDPDTNGDGIPDGIEVASGQSATNSDLDGDGLLNAEERALGTDPFRADTDGDTYADGADCFPLDPARWQCPSPTPGDTTPPVITLTEPTNAVLVSSNP